MKPIQKSGRSKVRSQEHKSKEQKVREQIRRHMKFCLCDCIFVFKVRTGKLWTTGATDLRSYGCTLYLRVINGKAFMIILASSSLHSF